MSRSEESTNDDTSEHAGEWFAMSTLRIALALLGFVLLLFALGQAIGVDLLGAVVDALDTRVGRWLVVAFFAVLIIAFAVRGLGTETE